MTAPRVKFPLAGVDSFLEWLSDNAAAFVAPGMLESIELAGERAPAAIEYAAESAYERVSAWFGDVCPDIPEDSPCPMHVRADRDQARHALESEAMQILTAAAAAWTGAR